jgi:hypothetical protein
MKWIEDKLAKKLEEKLAGKLEEKLSWWRSLETSSRISRISQNFPKKQLLSNNSDLRFHSVDISVS